MYEVEVKIPADLDAVRERLESLDAEPRGADAQADTYFDHPDRSFAATDEALRIRRQGGRLALTYKGPKVDGASKTRRELETAVGDGDATAAILRALGFDRVATVEKTRERYTLDGYTVTLDRVDGVGAFVEVEATGDEAEIEALHAGALDVLDRLELDPDDQVRASYLELLLDARE